MSQRDQPPGCVRTVSCYQLATLAVAFVVNRFRSPPSSLHPMLNDAQTDWLSMPGTVAEAASLLILHVQCCFIASLRMWSILIAIPAAPTCDIAQQHSNVSYVDIRDEINLKCTSSPVQTPLVQRYTCVNTYPVIYIDHCNAGSTCIEHR